MPFYQKPLWHVAPCLYGWLRTTCLKLTVKARAQYAMCVQSLTIKTLEYSQLTSSDVFIVNFEHALGFRSSGQSTVFVFDFEQAFTC